ncbi:MULTISPECIES: helix-turn-helix transcriptional regulator [unclassified Streptomyces]|uniref:helix-turn-helix transcriptional regulator n=1 Tax=unclassified Streptomyces TaxID=2593676 RepID=UPI002E19936E
MPPRGETKDEPLPECSAEEDALARALREACHRARRDLGSQKNLAEQISCAESTLSSWIRGRKIPHLAAACKLLGITPGPDGGSPGSDAKELHALSSLWVRAKAARAFGHAVEEAERLLLAEAKKHAWDPGIETVITTKLAFDDFKPAHSGVEDDGLEGQIPGTEVFAAKQEALPVPPSTGDRQHLVQQPPANTGLEEQLATLIGSKAGTDTLPVLNHIAAKYPVDDIVQVVRVCRGRSTLSPAADVVLRNAGHSRSTPEIFALADALHHAGRSSDAGLLISVATAQHPMNQSAQGAPGYAARSASAS